ncbi:MAG: glycosyltransferase [Candidatus Edwardsbacteria bacterium]|nr:glycosyltransferase [Candidatus Edwardsbacteria bacterium]
MTFPVFLAKLTIVHPSLIIARSYPAALLAYWVKKIFGIPYVFDLRGMYPEECVNAEAFALDSADYASWKRIERKLIAGAARCVVVSGPFEEHVRSIVPDANPDVIPCCVDPDRYGYDEANRERIKARYGLTGRFVLLHLGSFGTPSDRGLAGEYFLRFRQVEPSATLVIASGTPAFGPAIRAALLDEGLAPDDFRIFHPAEHEVIEMLALGDAGLLLERKVLNTKVCLSVKLGEYLASGLPVICTPFVEGAARLISQYNCGLVVDPDGNEPLDKEREFLRDLARMRHNGLALARSVLSLDACAENWSRSISAALTLHERGTDV